MALQQCQLHRIAGFDGFLKTSAQGFGLTGLLSKKIKFNNELNFTIKFFYCNRKVQIRKKSCKPLAKEAERNATFGISESNNKRGRKKKKVNSESEEGKTPDMDPETFWRDCLTFDNLKLFYKTQSGSFRKIKNDETFEKLKLLLNKYEATDAQKSKTSKVTVTVEVPCEKEVSEAPNRSFNLRLPDLVIRNMTNFPLLRCNNSEPETLTEELKNAEVNSYSFPSVTRILSETKSKESVAALLNWEQKMIAKLGEKGFLAYKEALLKRGSKFHSCVQKYLEAKDERPIELDEDTEGVWRSLEKVLPMISDVRHLETNVAHPILLYKGIVDCVASYQDIPCVIEWKKSDRKKGSISATYDAPLQCCAYLGALAWSKTSKNPVTNGLVVIAYTDGSPADVYKLDPETCSTYWLHWLQRLQHYWVLNSIKKR